MKRIALLIPFLLLLGCGVGVDLGTAMDLAEQDAEVVPRVPTQTAIRAFDKYCYRNAGNPGRTVTTLKNDGYKLLVTSRRDGLFGYAHPTRPFVGVIDDRLQPGCMVMVQQDPQVRRAYDNFVRSRHPGAVDAGRSQGLDRTWIVPGRRDRIFTRKLDGTEEVLLMITR